MKRRSINSIRSDERISIQIKDASISKARDLKVLVGEVDDVFKDDGPVFTNLNLGAIIGIGIGSGRDLSFEVFERVDVRIPFASIGIVVEEAFQLKASSSGNGLGHGDIPKRIVVFGIFGLTLLELDESERIIGIGTNIGFVDELEDGRLANVLVILGIICVEEMDKRRTRMRTIRRPCDTSKIPSVEIIYSTHTQK